MRIIPSRKTDPETSHKAERDVAFRANTQKHKLLVAYHEHWLGGMTDEEAAIRAGLDMRSCWWKRCSELREMGLIHHTGDSAKGSLGSDRMICEITSKGKAHLVRLS